MTAMVQLAVCFQCLLEMCNFYYTTVSKYTSLLLAGGWAIQRFLGFFSASLETLSKMRLYLPWQDNVAWIKMYCGLHVEKYVGIQYLTCFKESTKYLENQIIMADTDWYRLLKEKQNTINKTTSICGNDAIK